MLFQSVVWAVFLSIIPTAFLHAASPQAARQEAEAIAKAGEWKVLDVQRSWLLGDLGRVQILVENADKERKLLKLSHSSEVGTLAKGDVVRFTLAPVLEGKGVEGLPAFDTSWGGKVPNPFLLNPGSYLIPHRRR